MDKSIYICKIIFCLGTKIKINEKQEMWDIWLKFRNNLLKTDEKLGVNNILKSVFNLEDYEPTTTIEKWGCIDDIYCLKTDIKILDKKDIYSPIEIIFESYGYPPFKWCRYLQLKGFIINLYFLDLDGSNLYKKNCGKFLYSFNNYICENYCKIPKIELNNFKRYTSLSRIKYVINQKYNSEKICYELNKLLELYQLGINTISNKFFKELCQMPKLFENKEIDINEIKLKDI